MMEPKAGKVPGMKELAKLAAPSATSSRLGLIEYPKRALFCLAATTLSKKPTTDIRLLRIDKYGCHENQKGNCTDMAVEVVLRRNLMLDALRGNSMRDSPVCMSTAPRISMPFVSHPNSAERTVRICQTVDPCPKT